MGSYIMAAAMDALTITAGLSALILAAIVMGAWVRLAAHWIKRAMEGRG